MAKARTIWRKKRGGKFYGNWLVTVNGTDVNLGTKSATIAHGLVPEAERGRREFQSDPAAAAAALDQVDAGGSGGGGGTENPPRAGAPSASIPPTIPPPPAPTLPPAAAQTAPPAQAAAAQTAQAQSPEENARAEAEATNAAASETSTAADPAAANDNAGGAAVAKMDPAAIQGLLAVGAEAMVELQLGLQAWVIKRKTGKEPGLIPADAPMRKIAIDCWSAQFVRWFPNVDDVPPWVLGLVVVGACAPYQLATATPIPKKDDGVDLGAAAGAAAGAEQAAA